MLFREFETSSGKNVFLGKDAVSNDDLVKEFQGKTNVVMHTAEPGSPFCVFEKVRVSKKDIDEAAVACASRSQDWRDNKNDVKIHLFTGKDVSKTRGMKPGSWKLLKKPKIINIDKKDIQRFLKK